MSENEKKPTKADLEAKGYKADTYDGDGDGMVQDGTEFERPEGYNIAARDGDGDGLVQDGTVFEREAGTELSADELASAVEKKAAKGKTKDKPVQAANHVVSGNDKDDVVLSQAVYKNMYQRKSLTVHQLQRRLAELGYGEALGDKDGWYGENTKVAVENYQANNQFEVTGLMDAATFSAVFAGDHNVNVVID